MFNIFRNLFHSKQLYSFNNYCSKSPAILVEKVGNVTTLMIDRPESKNQMDSEILEALNKEMQYFEEDETAAVAVIYGNGGNFCPGIIENSKANLSSLVFPTKPVVAGLTGYTTGIGFELALLCDLRVMERTAQIGFNSQPYDMSEHCYRRLLSLVGLSVTLDLTLTGRNLQAKEAFECQLINRIVDCGTGIGQAFQLAKSVSRFPISTIRTIKTNVYSAAKS